MRASHRLLALSVLVLTWSSFLSVLVSGGSCGADCDDYNCGWNYSCSCYYNYDGNYNYADCYLNGGYIAGIVIACVVGSLILCCLCYVCARRRGYYAGQTYGTQAYGVGVPVQSYAVASQYPQQQPMQAVQYANSPQAYGQPVYAQQPGGGGQPFPQQYNAASAPPSNSGASYNVSQPDQQPTTDYTGGGAT